jgi:hypothetical protein
MFVPKSGWWTAMPTVDSAMKRRLLNTGDFTTDKVGVPGFETFPCSHSLMRDGEVEILVEGRPCAKVRGDGFLAGEIRGEPRLAVVFSTQVQMWPPSCGRIAHLRYPFSR